MVIRYRLNKLLSSIRDGSFWKMPNCCLSLCLRVLGIRRLAVAGKSVSLACGEHSASTAIKMGFKESRLSKKSIMGSTGQRVWRGKVNPRLVFGVLLYFTVL